MAHDTLLNELTRAAGGLLGDLSDLVHKEIRLAKAEIADKISSRLRAGAWTIVAAFLGLIAALLAVEGVVLAIASLGLALYWSCFLVAAVLAVVGVAIFFYGRSVAEADLMPHRAARQIKQDFRTAKEQLT
jgi:hypothetical protein